MHTNILLKNDALQARKPYQLTMIALLGLAENLNKGA